MLRKSFLLVLITAISCASASSAEPALLDGPIFSKFITSASNEFKQKDRIHRYQRYFCYGLLGAGFALAIFRNASPSPSRAQEKWVFDKVRELDQRQTNTPVVIPTRGFFKSILYSTAAVTAGLFASFIRDGLLGNLAYGLISPVLDPIHRFMNSHRTLLSGDVWFLREQVRESRAPFVLVSMDLSNFIDELKSWELEVRYYTLLLTTPPTNDSVELEPLLAQAEERICRRVARISGHIMYMRDKALEHEQLTMEVLHNTLQHYLELSLNEWLRVCATSDNTAKKQATESFEKSTKSTLLPLLSVSLYRIHPWPASVACSDYARLCVTSMAASYGNPVLQ